MLEVIGAGLVLLVDAFWGLSRSGAASNCYALYFVGLAFLLVVLGAVPTAVGVVVTAFTWRRRSRSATVVALILAIVIGLGIGLSLVGMLHDQGYAWPTRPHVSRCLN